ncbi:MAG TPA: hypothetical protein DCM68_01775 [Verrucomicrobia bacterium]|nr:hypothetical protein [Verrucomicrobiota bacterium]
MSSLDKLKAMLNRAPTDVVGLDFASNGVRAVRMKKTAEGLAVVGADMLPAVAMDVSEDSTPKHGGLVLPANVQGRFAAVVSSDARAVLKLIRLPEQLDLGHPEQVLARLGIDPAQGECRVGTQVAQPATAKTEALLLAAALPESLATSMLDLLPKVGAVAPRFVGLSSLSVVNAFHGDPRLAGYETAHGLIHIDQDFSLLALFNQGRLSQLRTFSMGMATFMKSTMEMLGVDEETAAGVLADGAFDISHLIEQQTRELRSQYVGCRDFMERGENCTLKKLHVSGPAALATAFLKGAQGEEAGEEWNALDGYPDRLPGSMPDRYAAQPWLWSAAIGACLGVLEPS